MKRSHILLSTGALVLGLAMVGAVAAFPLNGNRGLVPEGRTARSLELQLDGQPSQITEPLPGSRTSLNLGAFRTLSTTGSWNVRLVQGTPGTGSLSLPDSPNFHILVQTDGETLLLKSEDRLGGNGWSGSGQPELDICAPGLTEVDTSGASMFNLDGLKTDRFTARLSGASDLAGSGVVGTLGIHASGASNVSFDRVTARDVDVEGSGTGNLAVRAEGGRVEGNLSGAVNLRIGGTPSAVNVTTSGLSAVSRN